MSRSVPAVRPIAPTARGWVLLFLVAVVGLFGLGVAIGLGGTAALDPVRVRSWVAGFGVLAPLVMVALQAVQVVVAPIPGQVLGLVAGYLFGPSLGTLYSLAGATIGSVVVFVVTRRLGRPFVVDVVDPETLARFDDLSTRRGAVVLFVVFLVPGLPDDLVCFVAGLTPLRIRTLTAVSVVGRLPGYFLVALAGADLATAAYLDAAVILALLVAVSLVVYAYRDRVDAAIDRYGGGGRGPGDV